MRSCIYFLAEYIDTVVIRYRKSVIGPNGVYQFEL